MKLYFYLLVIGLLGTCFACDPGVQTENIDPSKLYSVNCFISPQDTVYTAYIYRALELGSIADPSLAFVKDATVILSDGVLSDTLIADLSSNCYKTAKKNLRINEGKVYTLVVFLTTGQHLEAHCIVPKEPALPSIDSSRIDNDYLFDILWEKSEFDKYFVLSVKASGAYETTTPAGQVITAQVNARLDEGGFILDEYRQTNIHSGKVRNAFLCDSAKLTIFLRNIDEICSNITKHSANWTLGRLMRAKMTCQISENQKQFFLT